MSLREMWLLYKMLKQQGKIHVSASYNELKEWWLTVGGQSGG